MLIASVSQLVKCEFEFEFECPSMSCNSLLVRTTWFRIVCRQVSYCSAAEQPPPPVHRGFPPFSRNPFSLSLRFASDTNSSSSNPRRERIKTFRLTSFWERCAYPLLLAPLTMFKLSIPNAHSRSLFYDILDTLDSPTKRHRLIFSPRLHIE